MKKKWYVGFKGLIWEAFESEINPSLASHGKIYTGVMGPFTKRDAIWSVKNKSFARI